MAESCLLKGPPTIETFDPEALVRYRAFLDSYARNLETACAVVSAAMWERWLHGGAPETALESEEE